MEEGSEGFNRAMYAMRVLSIGSSPTNLTLGRLTDLFYCTPHNLMQSVNKITQFVFTLARLIQVQLCQNKIKVSNELVVVYVS